VDLVGGSKAFSFDANGNMTSDGTRTFGWDALNQLRTASAASVQSSMDYDGLRRRVRITESVSGSVVADTAFIWCDSASCEERGWSTGSVSRRPLAMGVKTPAGVQFNVTDSLQSGSLIVTDEQGEAVAAYSFDPWGRRTLESGADVSPVGFTGHRWHSASSTAVALYRGYDPDLGRWISEDPGGTIDGPNLFAYSRNRPIVLNDPLGLCSCGDECPSGEWQLDTYLGTTGGLGLTISTGYGVLKCKDNWAVSKRAKVQCYTWGLVAGIASVDFSIQVQGTATSGACNARELTPFSTSGWVIQAGPMSASGNGRQLEGGGLGVGLMYGVGKATCNVNPNYQ